MNILLSGLTGHMGREVVRLAESGYRGSSVTLGVDINAAESREIPCAPSFDALDAVDGEEYADMVAGIDCIVDFSHHTATPSLLRFAQKHTLPVVLSTTGHTDGEKELIKHAAEVIPVFNSANMSLGVALLVELAKKAACAMPDAEIEIIEVHHDRKLDAPSGTALMLADAIREVRTASYNNCGRHGNGRREANEIGISSVRIGNVVGEHEVLIGTQNETITLRHEAHSRALFAEGALAAAEFICGKAPGMYNMNDMVV